MVGEKEARRAPETSGVVFKDVVAGIINDVSKAIDSLPEAVGLQWAVERVVIPRLQHAYEGAVNSYRRAEGILAPFTVEWRLISSYTPEERAEFIFAFARNNPHVLENILGILYRGYLNAPRDQKILRRQRFLEARDSFNAENIGRAGQNIWRAPFPVSPYVYIDLPRISESAREGYPNMNTDMQLILGRALGIFGPCQSWKEFFERTDMVIIPPSNRHLFDTQVDTLVRKNPQAIIGLQDGKVFQDCADEIYYEGNPHRVTGPTNYSGVRADIIMIRPRNWYDRFHPFDELFEEGKSSPMIKLQIPTETLLQSV